LAAKGAISQHARMERRSRRSSDRLTALHLYLESQLERLAVRSIRVMTTAGEIVAAVGDDAYADEWTPTWTRRVKDAPYVVSFASTGERYESDDIAPVVSRILVNA
jgi:hypothetical protein